MPSVLVFTRTKQGAKRLAKSIAADGHDVGELHSDRSPSQRAKTLSAFRSGFFPVLVATNIAARGIDVSHITHVVNYDVPQVPEEYVHRIGRTGRAEATGEAFVLVSPEEERYLMRIERQLGRRIDRQKMADFDYTVKAVKPTLNAHSHQPASSRCAGKRRISLRSQETKTFTRSRQTIIGSVRQAFLSAFASWMTGYRDPIRSNDSFASIVRRYFSGPADHFRRIFTASGVAIPSSTLHAESGADVRESSFREISALF